MQIILERSGWEDLQYWLQNDRRMAVKIGKLIDDICRSPFDGIGKPEPLKYDFAGCWSRRIDAEHRIVYEVRDDAIIIHQCRFHYMA